MKRCSVAFCYNHRLVSSKFFYRFPKNIKFKQKWIEFVKKTRSDWPVDDHVNVSEVICEDHFHPEDYHNYYQHQLGFSTQLRLRANAVPTLPPKNEQLPPIVLEEKPRKKRNKPKTKSSKSQKSSKGRNVKRKQESSSSTASSVSTPSKTQNEDHMNIKEELLTPGDGISVEGMFEMICVEPKISICTELDEPTHVSGSRKRKKDDVSSTLLQMQQEHNYVKKPGDVHAKLKVLSPSDVNSLIGTALNQDVAEHESFAIRNDLSSFLKEQRKLENVENTGVTVKQEKTGDAQTYEHEFPAVMGKSQNKNSDFVDVVSLVRDEDGYGTRFVKQEQCEQTKDELSSDWNHIKKEKETNPVMVQYVCDRYGNIKEKEFPRDKNQFICDAGIIKQEKIESSWDSDEYEFHPVGNDISCVERIKQEETIWRKNLMSDLEGILGQERNLQNDDDMCDSFRDAEREVSEASNETRNILLELEQEEEEEEEEDEDFISEYIVVSDESELITKPTPKKHASAKNCGQISSIGQDNDLLTSSATQCNKTEVPIGKLESIFVENNCSNNEDKSGKAQQKSVARKRTREVMKDQEGHILNSRDENVNHGNGIGQLDVMKQQENMEMKDWKGLKSGSNEKSLNMDSACVAEPSGKWKEVIHDTWQRRASTRRRKKPQKFLEYGEDLRSLTAMEKPLRNKKRTGNRNQFPKSKKLHKSNMKSAEDHICKECNKNFTSAAKLKNHHNRCPVISCNICFKDFYDPVTFRVHTMGHLAIRKKIITPKVQVERRIMNVLSEGGDYNIAYKKNVISTAQTKDSAYNSSLKAPEGNYQYFKSSFS
ncbi:uncharacterized protein LOC143018280 [Oratosquilla oratoria]|uniref:uncharacterized protein LOC143018280 n=1 Tax=Oratosquilla oratoria TaxID=337810 RepID=UPI003F763BEC